MSRGIWAPLGAPGALGGLLLLASCSTIESEIRLQSMDVGERRAPASLELGHDDYRAALERWPWIRNGAQLHRRTLILGLRPSQVDLKRLDATRDSATEVEILARLAR